MQDRRSRSRSPVELLPSVLLLASNESFVPILAGYHAEDRVDIELQEVSIDALQAGLASGALTARQLAEAYLERIEAIDRKGPTLRSVLELNPDALEIADALDRERSQGHVRGSLHGVPIMLKDNIETADGMQTTAGSLALLGAAV